MSQTTPNSVPPSPARLATWLCLIAATAVVSLLLYTPRKPATRSQARAPQATNWQPVGPRTLGWNQTPKPLIHISDATYYAQLLAAEAEARTTYEEFVVAFQAAQRDRHAYPTHIRHAADIGERFARLGTAAIPYLLKATEHTDKDIARWGRLKMEELFPTEPAFMALMIRTANDTNADPSFRYECIFHLGKCPTDEALQVLRKTFKDDSKLRMTAAKSLAELGQKDAARTLYTGLTSDHYMDRYIANLGFKALAGRDLADAGYNWGENAFVSGPVEFKTAIRPIDDLEVRARRYQAVADYCKWLKAERPEIYLELDPAERMREKRRTANRK